MWSRASTPTPMVDPRTQWFGSGFGQKGSTSKRRGLHGPTLGGGLQRGLADAEGDGRREAAGGEQEGTAAVHLSLRW